MSGARLFRAMGEIGDSFILEDSLDDPATITDAGTPRRNRLSFSVSPAKWIVPAAALGLLLAVGIISRSGLIAVFPGDDSTKASSMALKINHVASIEPIQMEMDIGLFWDDAVEYTAEEIEKYYGTTIYPKNLPAGIEQTVIGFNNHDGGGFYLFRRSDGTVYYDQNSFLFLTAADRDFYQASGYVEEDRPAVCVTAAKERAIHDFAADDEENGWQTSLINQKEVMLTCYECESVMHYHAEFVKEGVHFGILGTNLSEEEFINLLVPYFE